MGLLRRIGVELGVTADADVRLDLAMGDEALRTARSDFEQGRWERVATQVQAMRDWDRRELWTRQLGAWNARLPAIDAWVKARPDSADARLVRGRHLIHVGWVHRGIQHVEHTSEKRFDAFHAHLEEAQEDLQQAGEIDREDPTPLAGLLHLARGLAFDSENVTGLLDEADRRCPHHVAAHAHALWFVSEKWGGSHDEMMRFARASSAAAPTPHRLHVLVAMAHLELFAAMNEKGSAHSTTMTSDAARAPEELRAAAAASVFARGYPMTPETVEDRNWFAAALWVTGHAEAHRVFETLGGLVTRDPFGIYVEAKPEVTFSRARRDCAAKASGI